jgi:GAF domain-containing protein
VFGDSDRLLSGFTMAVGTGITGWAAATGRRSINADAVLDLAQIASRHSPPLRSALAVPIFLSDELVGVFSAYSCRPQAFQDSDAYVLEQVMAELRTNLPKKTASSPVVAFPLQRR